MGDCFFFFCFELMGLESLTELYILLDAGKCFDSGVLLLFKTSSSVISGMVNVSIPPKAPLC